MAAVPTAVQLRADEETVLADEAAGPEGSDRPRDAEAVEVVEVRFDERGGLSGIARECGAFWRVFVQMRIEAGDDHRESRGEGVKQLRAVFGGPQCGVRRREFGDDAWLVRRLCGRYGDGLFRCGGADGRYEMCGLRREEYIRVGVKHPGQFAPECRRGVVRVGSQNHQQL